MILRVTWVGMLATVIATWHHVMAEVLNLMFMNSRQALRKSFKGSVNPSTMRYYYPLVRSLSIGRCMFLIKESTHFIKAAPKS